MSNCVVESTKRMRDFLWQFRAQVVKNGCQGETEQGSENGDSRKQPLCCPTGLTLGSLGLLLGRRHFAGGRLLRIRNRRRSMKHGRQKLVKMISTAQRSWDAYPATNERQHSQNHQRNEHDFRAFMDSAMPMGRGHPCPRNLGMRMLFLDCSAIRSRKR